MKHHPKKKGSNRRLKAAPKAPTFESLEPRLMLSADGAEITLLTPPPPTVAEGQAIALSVSCTDTDIDSVPHTLSINWGDGTDPDTTDDLTQAFNANHTYADDGDFTINISVNDPNGEEGALAQPITVNNVAPTLTLVNSHPTVLVGGSIALTAETADVGTQDTVGVAWDITHDGNSVASGTGQTVAYSPTQAGDYLITVTAADNDGGQTTATSTVTAVPNDLTLTLDSADTATEGTATTVTLSIADNTGTTGTTTWGNTSEVVGDPTSPISDAGQTRSSYLWVDPVTGAQTLYFSSRTSASGTYFTVSSATRASSDAAFGPATLVYSIPGSHVYSPWVSNDGLRLYVYRTISTYIDPVGTQLQCITRASTNVAFDPNNSSNVNHIEITGTNPDTGSFYRPSNFTLSSDELTIIFDDPINQDLYMATRASIGDDFTDINITNLSKDGSGNTVNDINNGTDYREITPSLSADGLTLYFASNRSGFYRIYRATRASTSNAFGDAELVDIAGFTSTDNVKYPSISRDDQSLYFQVATTSDDLDLYVAELTSSGPGITGPLTMTVDWGDGTVETLNDVASTVDLNHTYADNGTYLQTLFVTDGTIGGQITHEVAVQNVAPTITDFSVDKTSVNENGTVTVTGVINDPGTLDTQTVAIDWGDGTSVELALADPVTRTFSVSHQYLDDAPSGTPQDTYTITATATDKDGDSGTAETGVTVVNVAPTVSILNVPGTAVEGDVIQLNSNVVDPGTQDTMTYAWVVKRDGTDVASGSDASLSFTAEDNGHYQVSLTVTDDDTGVGTASAAFEVLNVAPLLGGLALSATKVDENGQVTLTGSITDPGILDTHTVTVDWGDNSTSNIALAANDNGTFSLQHQYLDDNPTGTPSDQVTVSVTATDKDGGSVTNTLDLTVNNVPPTASILGIPTNAAEGDSITLTSQATDVGTLDTLSYAWSVVLNNNVIASGSDPTLTFTPPDNGTYQVNLTVTDDDTGATTVTETMTVGNVNPVLDALQLSSTEIDENGQVTLTGSITDPGILDTHTVTVDWGDNSTSDIALAANDNGTFSLQHQYLDDNPTGTPSDQVTVSVTATDKDGGSVTGTLNLIVKNVAPTITSLTTGASSVGAVGQGETTTIQVQFSDVGTQDSHTVTLDLGDGSTQTVNAVNGIAQLDHAYSEGGIYTVTATVTDDDGGTTTQQALAVITGVSLNADGVLTIVGTSHQDVILVRQLSSFCNSNHQTLAIGASFLAGSGYGYGWRLVDRSLVQRIVILAGDGNDFVHVSCRVDVSCVIDGGAGNDMIRGGSNGDVLMGDEGYDLLWGGGGNDILIGGEQSDLIVGGSGEDILIDGSTAYDIDDSDIMVGFDNALTSLLDEWNSNGTYEERLSNIQNGGGENGLYVLNDTTLISDQAFDILYGGSGQDWLSYFCDDSI